MKDLYMIQLTYYAYVELKMSTNSLISFLSFMITSNSSKMKLFISLKNFVYADQDEVGQPWTCSEVGAALFYFNSS